MNFPLIIRLCILIGLSSIDVYRKKKYSSNNEYEFQIISSSEFNFFENKIIACENGILSFHKNTWKILLPFDLSELYKGVFDDMDSDEEIYRTRLTFNETYFPNLIKDSKNENRQLWLLDIAKDMMKGIEN